MRRVLALLASLLALPALGVLPTGSLTNAWIDRTGCFLVLQFAGMSDGGTFAPGTNIPPCVNPYKVALTVTTEGYNQTPGAGIVSKTRTVYAGGTNVCVPYNSIRINGGVVTGGPFQNGETIIQATTGDNRIVTGNAPCAPLFVLTNHTATASSSDIWTGQSSGATYAPNEAPPITWTSGNYYNANPPLCVVDAVANLTLMYPLSESIHSWESATLTLTPAIYTQGANSTLGATNFTVVNQSVLPTAYSALRWLSMPGKLIGSNGVVFEALGGHQSAQSNAPFARVEFVIGDYHGNLITNTAIGMQRSTEIPVDGTGSNFICAWHTRFTPAQIATLVNLDTAFVEITGYPWWSDGTRVRTSWGQTGPGTLANAVLFPSTNLLDWAYAHLIYASVNPTNGVNTGGSAGWAATNYSTALLHPFASMDYAMLAVGKTNFDGRAGGAHIRLMGTNVFGIGAFAPSASNACVVIEPDPSEPTTTTNIFGFNATSRNPPLMTLIQNCWIATPSSVWCYGATAGGNLCLSNDIIQGAFEPAPSPMTGYGWINGGQMDNAACSGANYTKGLLLLGGVNLYNAGSSLSYCSAVVGTQWTNSTWGPSGANLMDNCVLAFNRAQMYNGNFIVTLGLASPFVTNVWCVANVVEGYYDATSPTVSTLTCPEDSWCFWNNAFINQREDWQNGWTSSGVVGTDVAAVNQSRVANILFNFCPNEDWFDNTAWGYPKLVSKWDQFYGVDWAGNIDSEGLPLYAQAWATDRMQSVLPHFASDQSCPMCFVTFSSQSGRFQRYEKITWSTYSAKCEYEGSALTSVPFAMKLNLVSGLTTVPGNGVTITGASSGATGVVSATSRGHGGGDYRLQSDTPTLSHVRPGRVPLPFDLDGHPYDQSGVASAIGPYGGISPVRSSAVFAQ